MPRRERRTHVGEEECKWHRAFKVRSDLKRADDAQTSALGLAFGHRLRKYDQKALP